MTVLNPRGEGPRDRGNKGKGSSPGKVCEDGLTEGVHVEKSQCETEFCQETGGHLESYCGSGKPDRKSRGVVDGKRGREEES